MTGAGEGARLALGVLARPTAGPRGIAVAVGPDDRHVHPHLLHGLHEQLLIMQP